jgi:hypothetical protein
MEERLLAKRYGSREAAYRAAHKKNEGRVLWAYTLAVFANGERCSFWDEGERPSRGMNVKYHWQLVRRVL